MTARLPIKPPFSDADFAALQQRNAARVREAIERLGVRYVCHPEHAPRKVERPQSLLVY